jgi:hypothetical protein
MNLRVPCRGNQVILRLSQRLAGKLKVGLPGPLPADPNPFADWSAHLFTAERTQYILLTNTVSLYSAVTFGRGISSERQFLDSAIQSLHEVMSDDGLEFIYQRFVAPTTATPQFAKPLNRSVIGSMNDLAYHAQRWLIERGLSPHETSFKLNEIPFSALKYWQPREVLRSLLPAGAQRGGK